MSSVEILLEKIEASFAPGENIKGRVVWRLDKSPKKAELRLFWRTKGKGTQDASVLASVQYPNPLTFHEAEFSFTAPNGPYSYSGRLISVCWGLELEVHKEIAQIDIVVSPAGAEIEMPDLNPRKAAGIQLLKGRKEKSVR
jgi:hypothetical protein